MSEDEHWKGFSEWLGKRLGALGLEADEAVVEYITSIAQLGCSDGGDDDDTREGIEGFLAEMTEEPLDDVITDIIAKSKSVADDIKEAEQKLTELKIQQAHEAQEAIMNQVREANKAATAAASGSDLTEEELEIQRRLVAQYGTVSDEEDDDGMGEGEGEGGAPSAAPGTVSDALAEMGGDAAAAAAGDAAAAAAAPKQVSKRKERRQRKDASAADIAATFENTNRAAVDQRARVAKEQSKSASALKKERDRHDLEADREKKAKQKEARRQAAAKQERRR